MAQRLFAWSLIQKVENHNDNNQAAAGTLSDIVMTTPKHVLLTAGPPTLLCFVFNGGVTINVITSGDLWG